MLKTIHDFTAFDYFAGGAIFVLSIFILGVVANAVLKETGFGVVVNGLLLFVGVGTGVFVRALTLGFQ